MRAEFDYEAFKLLVRIDATDGYQPLYFDHWRDVVESYRYYAARGYPMRLHGLDDGGKYFALELPPVEHATRNKILANSAQSSVKRTTHTIVAKGIMGRNDIVAVPKHGAPP